MRLDGKVALVTGAGQGIGRAIALTLAREGADVVVDSLHLEKSEAVAESVRTLGRRALAVQADVSRSSEVNEMVARALKEFGRIDILVNNAAPSDRRKVPVEDVTEELWDKHLNVGLKGAFLCSKAVGTQMIKQKSGKIINIASVVARAPSPGGAPYSASKAAIISLTKSLAIEWGKHNINVNAVSPGTTLTPRLERDEREKPGYINERLKIHPIQRINRPEDIAATVLFLVSSEADNITGQEIVVDGGTTAMSPAHRSA